MVIGMVISNLKRGEILKVFPNKNEVSTVDNKMFISCTGLIIRISYPIQKKTNA